MILSEFIVKLENKVNIDDFKNQKDIIKKFNDSYYLKQPKGVINTKNFIDEEAEGITKKQIREIQKLGFKRIKVSQTISFAPLMFFGVLITLIFKGNLLILIKNFFF